MPGLSPRQREALEKQTAAGGPAREFLDRAATTCAHCGQGSSIFNERKEQIVKEAMAWFESPSAATDSHVAVRYIAALVEVVKLQAALEYRVAKADDAKVTLYGGDQTAG